MTKLRRLVTIGVLILLGGAWRSEAIELKSGDKQIVPSDGTGPYVIVVLSDGFTDAQQQKFADTASFVFNVQLFTDNFYRSHKDRFTVVTRFRAAQQSGENQWGISPSGGVHNCYITTTSDADTKIEDAVGDLNPRRTVIIANGVFSNGCTRNNWTYVWAGIKETSGVLEHEFGHLIAGLLDEYTLDASPFPVNGLDGNGAPDGPNCSTADPPAWSTMTLANGSAPAGRVEGCDYYSFQIYRPYANCRMNTLGDKFCPVCESHAGKALAELSNSTAEARSPRLINATFMQAVAPPRAVRLLIEIDSQAHVITILKAIEVAGPVTLPHRLIGTHAYEIRSGNSVATAVLAGNPFESRTFDGRGAGHPLASVSTTARMIIIVPRMTLADLTTRGVDVTFYKLDATPDRLDVTPERLKQLRDQNLAHAVAALSANSMSKALQQLR